MSKTKKTQSNQPSTTTALSILFTLLIGSAVSSNVNADHREYRHERGGDFGRVTQVEPVYRTVTQRVPIEECWIETIERERTVGNHQTRRSTLIGGLVGAAVGSKISSRHHIGNDNLGILAGTIIGASIGHEAGQKRGRNDVTVIESRDIERCETTYQTRREQQLVGYDVSYRYHGRMYRTHTREHPGRKIHVSNNFRRTY